MSAALKRKIKKGDSVLVVAGRDRGKSGKVTRVLPESGKVVVERLNIVKRHKKPTGPQGGGGIVEKEAPLDISDVMLRGASAKSDAVEWRLASADALPYEEETFQGAICTLAIHHFPALAPAFGEIFRVLDEGSLVLFTAFPEQMRGYWLRHYFPEMMERSIRQMPSRDAVLGALGEAGFELDAVVPYHIADDLRDLFLYAGKRRPELYLDPVVRANISSFAALCSPEELAAGLQGLRDDIASGSLGEVAERYAGDDGDYAYVIARKRRR